MRVPVEGGERDREWGGEGEGVIKEALRRWSRCFAVTMAPATCNWHRCESESALALSPWERLGV